MSSLFSVEDKKQRIMRNIDIEPSCSRPQGTSSRINDPGNYQLSQLRLSELPVTLETNEEPAPHHSAPSTVPLHRGQTASYLHCYPPPKSDFLSTLSTDMVRHSSSNRDSHRKDIGQSKSSYSIYENSDSSKEWKRKPVSPPSTSHVDPCSIPIPTSMGTNKNSHHHGDFNSDSLTPLEVRKKMPDGSGPSDICHRQCISDIPFKKRLANRSVDIGIVQNPVDVALIEQGLENQINIGIVENPVNIGILKNPNSIENLDNYMEPLNKVCVENDRSKPVCCNELVSKWLKSHPARINNSSSVKYSRDIPTTLPNKMAGSLENQKVHMKHISIPQNCHSSLNKYDKPGCSGFLEREDHQMGMKDQAGNSNDFRKATRPEAASVCSTSKSDCVDSLRMREMDVSHSHNTASFPNGFEHRLNKYNSSSSNSTYNLKICHSNNSSSSNTSENNYNFSRVDMYPINIIKLDDFKGVSDFLRTLNEEPNKKKKIGNIGNAIPIESSSNNNCNGCGASSSSSSSNNSSSVGPSTSDATPNSNTGALVAPGPSSRFANVLNLSFNENLDSFSKTGNSECAASSGVGNGSSSSDSNLTASERSVDCVVNLSQNITDNCNNGAKTVMSIDRPSGSGTSSGSIISSTSNVHPSSSSSSSSHKAVIVNVPNLSADSGMRPTVESNQKGHGEQLPNPGEKDLEMEFYESVLELENEYSATNVLENNVAVTSTPSLSNGTSVDSSTTTVSVDTVNNVSASSTPEGTNSDIKCRLCRKTFKYESNLQSHMSAHKRRKCFKCEQCTKTFTFLSDYYQHTLLHHSGLTLYTCDYCQEQFLSTSELESHRVTHDGKRPYQCRYCEKNYIRKGDLKKHLRVHSGERPYQCELCGKSFSAGSGQLAKHLRIHLDEKPFSCNYCNKTFTDKANADKHMMFHVGEKLFKCTLCSKAFMQKCDLSRHIRTHTGEKPHTCEYCGKAFSDQSAFSKHRRIHTGEGMLKCTHCDKTFNNPYNRTRHMRLHTRERAFPCDLCDKIFTCNYSVKMHRRIHTGEKPHKCDYCFKTFISSSNLNKHLKTHHPVKAVKYECCGTMYADPAALDEHFKSHGAKQS
ncbi:XP_029644716.1uncharacterized protein LOC115218876 [Octopus vulgaris]|uniref:XP_029644716.1uncharacterized protein LOC115218876 n=2 Tax=Octopus TaxID=6643 RepID=A0AA36BFF6_OCTVU|nr:uncharacterized protein LOC115218876 [Octopus sinensis]XP_029644717.1 uncharacterized protein LOC115218876 [Octopus sinensis]XP_029644718.1 uncharacterized protein LOC115218876 [Octopus sinensis]XP_029644719.1 uncharacterized protein LOC115218876 [Octopus sinensis]XP_029644720.1 uncharacterized protein LOC115218876 [Octopus sinensis]XP_036364870.1 uncharacterized protein LOC115218876 [Octopus sinensis]XP_036364871.1 uncharacterized protein LOC115218876 [Octopus sinensis]CAI9733063.1 XP_02